MVSLQDFKVFANLPREAVPAKPSFGLLVINKATGHEAEAFSIPSGSIFATLGMGFVTSEDFELSESARMIEIAVTARVAGQRGNILANQVWTSPIDNLTATNPAPFSLGADSLRAVKTSIDWERRPDSLIQSQLDIAIENIKTKLGGVPGLPDDPRVDRAVYLLAQFYMENRSTQETQTALNLEAMSKQKTAYYRERVYQAINREINNLLNPFIPVSKFMPETPGDQTANSLNLPSGQSPAKF